MKPLFTWMLARMGENSTWRGIIALLTAVGITFSPEQAEKIIAAGLSLIGLINVFRKQPTRIEEKPKAETTTNT